jgi:hypothetical protein
MGQRYYCTIAGLIFIIFGLIDLGRLCAGWDTVLANWQTPAWLSWFGLFLGGAFGGIGLWLGDRNSR